MQPVAAQSTATPGPAGRTGEGAPGGPETRSCDAALARAFAFLGKRWNGVILGVLLRGPASFGQLRRAVAGICDSVLSDRLAELARVGLVTRHVDEGPPVSVTYALTPSGAALSPALSELATWAGENLAPDEAGPDGSVRPGPGD